MLTKEVRRMDRGDDKKMGYEDIAFKLVPAGKSTRNYNRDMVMYYAWSVRPRTALQGNDNEITQKQEAAEKVLAEARQAAQKEIQDAKNEAQGQSDKRLNEVKSVRRPSPSLHASILSLLLCTGF